MSLATSVWPQIEMSQQRPLIDQRTERLWIWCSVGVALHLSYMQCLSWFRNWSHSVSVGPTHWRASCLLFQMKPNWLLNGMNTACAASVCFCVVKKLFLIVKVFNRRLFSFFHQLLLLLVCCCVRWYSSYDFCQLISSFNLCLGLFCFIYALSMLSMYFCIIYVSYSAATYH